MREVIDSRLASVTQMRGLRGKGLVLVVAAVAALAALGGAAPAFAGLQKEFSVFDECPLNVPAVGTCVYSKVTGGEFTLGSKTVPIDKTVILQGGIGSSAKLVPAANGETLSKTALTVPGGLVGIEGLGGEVTATAELAGAVELSSTNLVEGKGTAVSLPLKVHLENPFLGSGCYIGEESQPVAVHLTTGTTSPPGPNKPITGSVSKVVVAGYHKIVTIPSSTLVDNAFSVPGANGCGGLLALLIDPLVDTSAGVPAAAGHNTAIMSGSLETASANEVEGERGLPEIGSCELAESTGEGKEKAYEGDYDDKGCTIGDQFGAGKYEWHSGPGTNKRFTGKGSKVTLESVDGVKVTCSASSLTGEYTGPKSAVATATFTGCERAATKEPCQSASAASGEIVAPSLAGELGFIEDEATESALTVSVGLDLSHAPTLLSAECAGAKEALDVTGSVIAPITKVDKMSSTFSLGYKASVGAQQPEAFEEGSKDTLTATLGQGAEQAGLTTKVKLTNEEKLEIRAIHE
jgi:hypothetical protein